jgi:membrane protein insertase Oxa1/YidC/SpoIIIJ
MMQLMMPLMFGFITFTLPSGLGLYFVVTSIFSIGNQYFIYGWGNLGLGKLFGSGRPKQTATEKEIAKIEKGQTDVTAKPVISDPQEGKIHGKSRSKRKNS